MAIQNRRGAYADFNPAKMVEGEFAVVKTGDPNTNDGDAVYISTATGTAKRVALYQDIVQEVESATEEVAQELVQQINEGVAESVERAETAANAAEEAASTFTTDTTLSISGKAADAKKTGDEITGLKSELSEKAAVITNTASGSIATFHDGSAMPVKNLTVGIEPVQDLHGYDAPWPGGGRKNLLDNSALTKGYYQDSGSFVQNDDGSYYTTPLIPVVAGQTYTMSYYNSQGTRISGLVTTQWASNGDFIRQDTSGSVAMGSTTAFVRLRNFQAQSEQMKADGTNARWQMETGSNFTEYVPYSNICPITGWTAANVKRTGKNLLDLNGYTSGKIRNDSGTVTNDSSSGFTVPIRVLPSTKYTISGSLSSYVPTMRVYFLNENQGWIRRTSGISTATALPYTFTTDSNCYYVQLQGGNSSTGFNAQIEVGQSATTYEEPHIDTYAIPFPSAAGTVYGGTVDLEAQTLTVEWKMVTLNGGENWQISGQVLYLDIEHDYLKTYTEYIPISNRLKGIVQQANISAMSDVQDDNIITLYGGAANYWRIFAKKTDLQDVDAFKGWLLSNNVQFCYKLATPVTYQLTPVEVATILGTNNIWADTGDSNVEYRADTKLYIEQLTAPTEDDMTADHAIASGTFFMVGNSLYRATTAIAAGATITVGTNATKLSLADALNALS